MGEGGAASSPGLGSRALGRGRWAEATRRDESPRPPLPSHCFPHPSVHTRACATQQTRARAHTDGPHGPQGSPREQQVLQLGSSHPHAPLLLCPSLLHVHGLARPHTHPAPGPRPGISHLEPTGFALPCPEPQPDTPHVPGSRNSPDRERERGSAEERLGRQEEWGEPSGLTYLYPGRALPMGRTGGGSRGQPSCPGPAQCVPGQGPSAGQPGTRSCPGQWTWASLVHRRGPQWGGRPQCAQLGLSFREPETGAVYGDREQVVPPDSQGRGPEVVGDPWDAALRQDLGSVPGTARATSPPQSPSLLHSGRGRGQEPGPGGHRLAPNRGRRPAGLLSGERPWARRRWAGSGRQAWGLREGSRVEGGVTGGVLGLGRRQE